MFIAAGALVGIVVAYDDYSDHSNHSKYGDAAVVARIEDMKRRERDQESEIQWMRNCMNTTYGEQIDDLKREKNYPALTNATYIIDGVRADMARELDESIADGKRQLADIDRMLARINELELQAKG